MSVYACLALSNQVVHEYIIYSAILVHNVYKCKQLQLILITITINASLLQIIASKSHHFMEYVHVHVYM